MTPVTITIKPEGAIATFQRDARDTVGVVLTSEESAAARWLFRQIAKRYEREGPVRTAHVVADEYEPGKHGSVP